MDCSVVSLTHRGVCQHCPSTGRLTRLKPMTSSDTVGQDSHTEESTRMERMPTRAVRIGKVQVGDGAPIVVQSMCATKTTAIDATVAQVHQLEKAKAGIVRIAVDN